MRRSVSIILALLMVNSPPTPARAEGIPVAAIRFGHDAERVRMVLDLAATAPFTWDMAGDGRHLTVTLIGIDWRPPKAQKLQSAGALVGYRFVPAPGGAGQVELEAASPLRVLSVRDMAGEDGASPHRIVIDLAPKAEPTQPDQQAAALLDRGVRAALGLDGAADFAVAVEAFARAAEAGSAQASFNLGELYRAGKGVPQDYRQAAEWFRRAAEAGFAPARFHLAVLAFNGVGVPRDRERARALVEQAAAQGLPQARRALEELSRAGLAAPVRMSQGATVP